MKIDVILPIYKGELWVGEAIDSVLAQTYANWHLTVVDDACPGDTVQQVKAFCSTYPDRITLIRLERNRMAAGARMEAIRQTSGEVVTFLDQDDRWYPQKLEKQVERFHAQPVVQAVHTGVVHIDSDGNPLIDSSEKENATRASIPYDRLSNEELCKSLFLDNPIRLVSSAILREAFESVGGFNETLFGGEDWEFWVRFSNRWRIGYLVEPLIEHRIHAANVSTHFRGPRSSGLLTALGMVEEAYPYLAPLANKRWAYLLPRAVVTELENRDYVKARQYACSLVRLRPLDIRALGFLGIACTGSYGHLILNIYRRLKTIGQKAR